MHLHRQRCSLSNCCRPSPGDHGSQLHECEDHDSGAGDDGAVGEDEGDTSDGNEEAGRGKSETRSRRTVETETAPPLSSWAQRILSMSIAQSCDFIRNPLDKKQTDVYVTGLMAQLSR